MSRGRQISRLRLKDLAAPVRERYLLEWTAKQLIDATDEFPRLTSSSLFGNQQPLHVEIGPGTGEFLCHLAEENPEINYLGIEASRKAAYYLVDLAAKRDLPNLFVIKANFKLLSPLMVNESWQQVYLHFPDPIHRRKEMKHRIFDEDFLQLMAKVLQARGRISVVSDEQVFFDQMLAVARKSTAFVFVDPKHEWQPYQSKTKSRFQAFWESKGIEPRQFVLVKKDETI